MFVMSTWGLALLHPQINSASNQRKGIIMSSDIENIDNRIKWLTGEMEARSDRLDPYTKERGYVRDPEWRRKAQLQVDQLNRSREYQLQVNERLRVEKAEAQAQNQALQEAHRQEQQAIRDRAGQIRIEQAAQRLANSGADLDVLNGKA